MNTNTSLTYESVLSLIREMAAKLDKSQAKFEQEMADSRAERIEAEARFAKEMAEANAKWERRMKNLDEKMGGVTNSNGLFAEEYFYNCFESGQQTFFGEKFDTIERNLKTGLNEIIKDEYDIVFLNGKTIGIVEVKYKGRLEDIPKIIKKAETFRINYPQYKNHQIYLAFATMIFNKRIEDECIKEGIAIVKQVGDTVVVNDEYLKTF
jgi:hypothetical protein